MNRVTRSIEANDAEVQVKTGVGEPKSLGPPVVNQTKTPQSSPIRTRGSKVPATAISFPKESLLS